MENKPFSIGVASDIVGIAPETIRHYERKGIIEPEVQNDNHYRKYHMHDICILGRARAYREYGFTLDEAREMMSVPKIEFVVDKLQERADTLEKKIFNEISTLYSIKKKISDIRQAYQEIGSFSIRNRPAMYATQTFRNGEPVTEQIKAGQAASWYGKQTITFPIWHFDAEQFEAENIQDYEVYMAVLESDAAVGEISLDSTGLGYLPPCTCLHTVTKCDINEEWKTTFAPVVSYMKQHGMHATGPIIWQTVTGHAGENEDGFVYCRNLWIPIT